ncbi:MAG TPA: glycosyltransferase family 4 protein [Roseiflexaceae bacterium]|nr:glycosyltransferase family 4 protein [Roseiflexaceae bacterium]HMP40886.1 glycosyltransferase family 4 protein [Roseiflexaceae bacterium]
MNEPVRQHYHYQPAHGPPAPMVCVVTNEAAGDTELTADLQQQSLQAWCWLHGGTAPLPQEPRLTAEMTIEAIDQTVAASAAPFVALLPPGSRLVPTFLEKAAWVLATHPAIGICHAQIPADTPTRGGASGVSSGGAAPFLIRRGVFLAAGGLGENRDAATLWRRLATRGETAYCIPEVLLGGATAESVAIPATRLGEPGPYEVVPTGAPFDNPLQPHPARQRLLIIMPWLIVGGAERVNLDLIRQLTADGYEVTLATTLAGAQHGWFETFAEYTSDIFVLDRFVRLHDTPRFLAYLINSRRIETVMISNSYLGYQILPFLRAACPHAVFVDYCHSIDDTWRNGGYPRCGVAYQELLDLNITSSGFVRDWMVARGADPARIEIAYTNVDVEYWQPDPVAAAEVRTRLGLHAEDLLLVFVGRLSHEKRPALLAHIIAGLQRRSPGRFRCLVIGDGPLRGELQQLVRALQIEPCLDILGRVDDTAMHGYLSAADVLLLPSQVEGISVAVFEAMAMEVIPISARVGGQAELISADVGVLVPHSASELDAYIDTLQQLLADPQQRRIMQQAARARVVQHFPLSAFGPRMAALYRRAHALREHAPRLPVSIGMGAEHAAQAFEAMRIEAALDVLWAERERVQLRPGAWRHAPRALAWRIRNTIRGIAAAGYRWGKAHGFTWLTPLREWLQRRSGR